MRTKILLSAVAALALGLTSSNAQVYSANVVGYYTLSLTNGYNLIANQLDVDGTGTNNTYKTVFPNGLPGSSKILAFNPTNSTYPAITYVTPTLLSGAANTNYVNPALAPGRGVFVFIPPSVTTPTNYVVVGTVMQGNLVTPLYHGFQIASSEIPISGGIQTVLGYVPGHGDKAYQWVATSQSYPVIRSWVAGTTWTPSQPAPAIGEAVFLTTTNNAWSTNFTVQ